MQSFLWGDYAASPGTTYRLRILPMFGNPGALTTDPKDEIKLAITTEKEAGLPINDQKITYRRSKTKIPHNKFIVRLSRPSLTKVFRS